MMVSVKGFLWEELPDSSYRDISYPLAMAALHKGGIP